jgi:hypothetical protein
MPPPFIAMPPTPFAYKMNAKSKEESIHPLQYPCHVNIIVKKIISPLMQTPKDLCG